MKVFVCALAILYVAAFVSCNEEMKTIFEECKKDAKITDEIKKGEKPDFSNPNVQCFFNCLGQRTGTIKDGKVDANAAIEFIKKRKELDEAKINNIKYCAEEANKLSGCAVGGEFKRCLIEKGVFGKKKEEQTE